VQSKCTDYLCQCIVCKVENRNQGLATFDFSPVLCVKPNVASGALYSASDALYSAPLATLGLTHRTGEKSNVATRAGVNIKGITDE